MKLSYLFFRLVCLESFLMSLLLLCWSECSKNSRRTRQVLKRVVSSDVRAYRVLENIYVLFKTEHVKQDFIDMI